MLEISRLLKRSNNSSKFEESFALLDTWFHLLDKNRGRCLQPNIELMAGSPVEELEKGVKKLKGFATPYEKQQYQYTWRNPWSPAKYVAL